MSTIDQISPSSPTARRAERPFVWQGLRLAIPADWSPVKIEGNFDRGFVSLADLDRQRLGVRWKKLGKRIDAAKSVDAAMRGEVGQLAFDESSIQPGDEWSAARLYVEPDPPGRDVWVGFSPRTNRLVQVVYSVQRREPTLAKLIVPNVGDVGIAGGRSAQWSAFWLNVTLPSAMRLTSQRLNVGDLALTFMGDGGPVTVRQVAAAGVALGRRPIEKWLDALGEPKRYRPAGPPERATVNGHTGLRQRHHRRRRLVLARWVPDAFVTYALRDEGVDRLTLVRAPNDAQALGVIEGIGSLDRKD